MGQRDAQLLRRAGAVFTAVSGTGALSAGWGFVFAWCNKTQHEMLSTGKHHQHFSNCFLSHFPTRNDQKNFLAKYFQEKKKRAKSVSQSISHHLLVGSFIMSNTADTVFSPVSPWCLFLRHALCPWHEGQEEKGSSRNLAPLSPRSISRGSLLWFNISPAKAAFILHLNTMRSELPKALEKSKYRSQSRADFPEMRSTKNSFLIKSCKSPY